MTTRSPRVRARRRQPCSAPRSLNDAVPSDDGHGVMRQTLLAALLLAPPRAPCGRHATTRQARHPHRDQRLRREPRGLPGRAAEGPPVLLLVRRHGTSSRVREGFRPAGGQAALRPARERSTTALETGAFRAFNGSKRREYWEVEEAPFALECPTLPADSAELVPGPDLGGLGYLSPSGCERHGHARCHAP